MSLSTNVTAYYGGLSNTTQTLNGNILSYGFWQQLRDNSNWYFPWNREIHYWESRYPAFQVPNSQGLVNPVKGKIIDDQFIFLFLTDEQGNKGEDVTMAKKYIR